VVQAPGNGDDVGEVENRGRRWAVDQRAFAELAAIVQPPGERNAGGEVGGGGGRAEGSEQ
jgi:hypothetical protein